jgi:hypothetical protein
MSSDIDEETRKAIAAYKGEVTKVPRRQRALPLLQPINWRAAAQNRKKKQHIKGPRAA